jgi:hypothetical protein
MAPMNAPRRNRHAPCIPKEDIFGGAGHFQTRPAHESELRGNVDLQIRDVIDVSNVARRLQSQAVHTQRERLAVDEKDIRALQRGDSQQRAHREAAIIGKPLRRRTSMSRIDPGAVHAHSHHRVAHKELAAITVEHTTRGIVRHRGEHAHVAATCDELAREAGQAYLRRADFRWIVLGQNQPAFMTHHSL